MIISPLRGRQQKIKVEIKEEAIDHDPLCVQNIQSSGDDNNTVVGDVDIVEHKIKIDNYD